MGNIVFPWLLFVTLLIWLSSIALSFKVEQWWKPLEALRLAAAQGDHRLLAREQPSPNPEALSVPVKISTRISQKGLLVFGSLFALLVIGATDASFLFTEWRQHLLDSSILFWTFSLAIIVGAVMIFILVVLWRQRWTVEVRLEGMRSWVKSMGMAEDGIPFLPWHEARLFACYQNPEPWSKGSLTYELSSASQVVLWTWVQKKKSLRIEKTPTIPFEEHQAQIHALCNLIAAKTGLSLYNLSTGEARKYDNL